MELSPRDKDKLLIFVAADVAQRRKDRGVKLNYPESVALISAAVMEGARDCLLYTSPSPRDLSTSRMPSSA